MAFTVRLENDNTARLENNNTARLENNNDNVIVWETSIFYKYFHTRSYNC